jgi:predicted nucleic-acid-binding protein
MAFKIAVRYYAAMESPLVAREAAYDPNWDAVPTGAWATLMRHAARGVVFSDVVVSEEDWDGKNIAETELYAALNAFRSNHKGAVFVHMRALDSGDAVRAVRVFQWLASLGCDASQLLDDSDTDTVAAHRAAFDDGEALQRVLKKKNPTAAPRQVREMLHRLKRELAYTVEAVRHADVFLESTKQERLDADIDVFVAKIDALLHSVHEQLKHFVHDRPVDDLALLPYYAICTDDELYEQLGDPPELPVIGLRPSAAVSAAAFIHPTDTLRRIAATESELESKHERRLGYARMQHERMKLANDLLHEITRLFTRVYDQRERVEEVIDTLTTQSGDMTGLRDAQTVLLREYLELRSAIADACTGAAVRLSEADMVRLKLDWDMVAMLKLYDAATEMDKKAREALDRHNTADEQNAEEPVPKAEPKPELKPESPSESGNDSTGEGSESEPEDEDRLPDDLLEQFADKPAAVRPALPGELPEVGLVEMTPEPPSGPPFITQPELLQAPVSPSVFPAADVSSSSKHLLPPITSRERARSPSPVRAPTPTQVPRALPPPPSVERLRSNVEKFEKSMSVAKRHIAAYEKSNIDTAIIAPLRTVSQTKLREAKDQLSDFGEAILDPAQRRVTTILTGDFAGDQPTEPPERHTITPTESEAEFEPEMTLLKDIAKIREEYVNKTDTIRRVVHLTEIWKLIQRDDIKLTLILRHRIMPVILTIEERRVNLTRTDNDIAAAQLFIKNSRTDYKDVLTHHPELERRIKDIENLIGSLVDQRKPLERKLDEQAAMFDSFYKGLASMGRAALAINKRLQAESK